MSSKKKAKSSAAAGSGRTSTAPTPPTTAEDVEIDFTNPVVCFNLLANYVNTANQRGAFNLGESNRIFMCVNSLATFINNAVKENEEDGGGGGE
jgi:hypothetical protein